MTPRHLWITLAAVAGAASSLTQPGSDAVLFAPGEMSTGAYELAPTFMPDGKSAYYTVSLPEYGRKRFIVEATLRSGKWSTVGLAPFSGMHDDADPFIAPDGRRMFFLSKRPVGTGSAKPDLDIWVVDRTGETWSAPRHLGMKVNSTGDEHYVTATRDGTLYISAVRPGGAGRGDVYRVPLVNGEYGEPESLGPAINSAAHETTPYIAPDESYMIFGSSGRPDATGRAIDLYISYRDANGWSPPQNLGPRINSVADDYCPIVSPDGATLYFSSERNFADEQRERVATWNELRDRLNGPGNSLGDIYTVAMPIVRRATGR